MQIVEDTAIFLSVQLEQLTFLRSKLGNTGHVSNGIAIYKLFYWTAKNKQRPFQNFTSKAVMWLYGMWANFEVEQKPSILAIIEIGTDYFESLFPISFCIEYTQTFQAVTLCNINKYFTKIYLFTLDKNGTELNLWFFVKTTSLQWETFVMQILNSNSSTAKLIGICKQNTGRAKQKNMLV